jgi:hypothetical protein
MARRFNELEKNISNLMKKHWKTPKGNTIRWIASCLDKTGIMVIACRDGAAVVRPYDPLDPDSVHLKDTSIGIMLCKAGTDRVFELSPVEFKYINQCWWEYKNNGKA